MVTGGFGSHQNMVEVAEQYDPKTDEWTRLPVSICVSMYMYVMLHTDNILVVLGGFCTHQNMVEVPEQYDPKTDEWTRLQVCINA